MKPQAYKRVKLELKQIKTDVDLKYPTEAHVMTELCYKEGARTQNIKITRREWDKLNPGEYLNDVLVLFWLKFYQYFVYPYHAKYQDPNSVFVFDPQFYCKMIGRSTDMSFN